MNGTLQKIKVWGGWIISIIIAAIMVNSYIQNPQTAANTQIANVQSQVQKDKELTDQAIGTINKGIGNLTNEIANFRNQLGGFQSELVRLRTIIELRLPKNWQ